MEIQPEIFPLFWDSHYNVTSLYCFKHAVKIENGNAKTAPLKIVFTDLMWRRMTLYLCVPLSSCLVACVLARCSVLRPRDSLLLFFTAKKNVPFHKQLLIHTYMICSEELNPIVSWWEPPYRAARADVPLRNISSVDSRCCC